MIASDAPSFWTQHKAAMLEVFVFANLAFLALDIYLAHSVNEFANPMQWVPFWFSIGGASLLVLAAFAVRFGQTGVASAIRYGVGVLALVVGIGGMLLHLDSRFFIEQTLKALVYSAPFVAPLSYAGLGFLLLINRMIDKRSQEWGRWIVFFALTGFVGNFALTLADHAQNGFFHPSEWIGVASAAFAVSFLLLTVISPMNLSMIRCCFCVMVAQIFVAIAGAYLHLEANLSGNSESTVTNFIYGAPIFAPLLFANLAILAGLGLYDLRTQVNAKTCEGR